MATKKPRGFEAVSTAPADTIIPTRSTEGSAGYDFCLPCDITIKPGREVKVITNIKAYMKKGEVLVLAPRSSVGNNLDVALKNTIGIVDSDYYNNESNEGNISACLVNRSEKVAKLKKGDRFMQGLFLPYLLAEGDKVKTKRTGGTGSTGK